MRKHVAALLAVLVAVLWPRPLSADATSCSLTSSSYGNSVLNPPVGEDTDFFVNNGGIPNVMFLLDTSASMLRLAPNGAGKSWGSFENPTSNSQGGGFGCWNAVGNALTYSSPCGTTTLEQSPFSATTTCVQNPNSGCTTAPPNYAEAKDSSGNYCPYMKQGSGKLGTANDKPGFDPDYYPTQFPVDRVFHDVVGWPVGSINDGWASATASAWGSNKSIADFCASQATQAKKDSCQSCMNATGYWFDGTYQTWPSPPSCASTADCQAHGFGTCIKDSTGLEWNTNNNDNTAHCAIPHVWLSGNFLNFNPPKHVVARKVLKDVLQSVRKIRLGVTMLSDPTGGDVFDKLNPSCNQTNSPSNFDSNRSSILNKFNGSGQQVLFQGGKPLAEALLDVGRLYAPDSATWWPGYDKTAFHEGNGGNQKSVCFSCQASAVIMLTDGLTTNDGHIPGTSNGDSTSPMTAALSNTAGVYAGDPRYDIAHISSADCTLCNTTAEAADTSISNGQCTGQQTSGACDDSSSPIQAFLPKVAWYLNNVDLRPTTEAGADGVAMTGKQVISTYTIGFGTSGNASAILDHTARMGGGLFNGGEGASVSNVKGLRDAILRSLEDVNTRSTSFGTASVSTLQSSASQGVLVPRFDPVRAAHWNGHLFAFDLFSEFTSGTCHIPATGASGPANGDYDCDGKCNSVFLRDQEGAFIQENATGAFVKNFPTDRAPCGTSNLCGGDCGVASTTPAKPYWDAGDLLGSTKADGTAKASTQYKGWQSRKIYTVVDSASSSDKKITSADNPPILLDDTTTQADLLTPYLNIVGGKYCFDLADRLTGVGNPAGATIRSELGQSPRKHTTCAQTLLRYVRGADVFNETNNACGTWPNTLCTRAYQLGDIFHSSPVTVYPPLPPPPVGILCDAGLHPQCLPSLWESDAPSDGVVAPFTSAYHQYQGSDRYKNRHRFALVGANDGLLHAFQNGSGAADVGTGEEIWAFLPPDLLAKLPSFTGSQHQYFVDGTPMVRDVWIDGLPNGSAGTATKDRKKQAAEFHTIAIVGERRGGTHYFALDVTDASDELDAAPKVLWIYPQPSDPAQLTYGETWSDFQPAPPPIGPVRIKTSNTPCSGNAIADGNVCFEERWVVFLSGGFDPLYTRGRGVHMLDVETGEELFDFSQPAGSTGSCGANSDPRCHLNFPVAATVGMMGWGNAELNVSPVRPKYFDTATFGDTGGQLWVVRFYAPGEKVNGKVTNWYGGRVLQVGKTATVPECDFCGGQPFFQLTANVRLVANGSYRVMAGTGDRFNLLDIVGGTCGPDNIRACLLKGCSVKVEGATAGSAGAQYAVTDLLGTATYQSNAASCSSTSGTTTLPGAPGTSCTGITQKIDSLVITCPNSGSNVTCSGNAETTTKKMSLTCGVGSGSEFCAASTGNDPGQAIDLAGNKDKLNWYFSVRVFDESGPRRIFTTPEAAIEYDKARLDDQSSALTLMNLYDADSTSPTSKLATPDGAGWRYYFNHGAGVTASAADQVTINNVKYDIFRTDERVASNSAVEMGCGFWNTMQPGIAEAAWNETTNCAVGTPCKAGKTQLAYTYSAKPATGEPCLLQKVGDTKVVRSVTAESLVPPNIGKLVAYVSSGQVSFGLTSIRVPGGGSNISLGEAQDFQSITEWLPVDKSLHACRHASRTGAAPTTCK